MITSFTPEVIEQLKFYVYRLIDPTNGKTFYVGKGHGNRVFAHINEALDKAEYKEYRNQNDNDESLKIRTIQKIKAAGLEVGHIIHRFGMDEATAFEVEAALIDCYREQGLTNIQNGHRAAYGPQNAEMIQQLFSCEEYEEQDEIKYIIIKIKDYYVSAQGNGDIYETVRKYWKINLQRANKTQCVLACMYGIVREVYEYKGNGWIRSINPPEECEGRCEFEGKVAQDKIRDLFLGKKLPKKYRQKGSASPILYHD